MNDQNEIPESEPFAIPDFLDRIKVTKAQLPGAFNPGTLCIQDIRDKIRAAETRAYGVVINTFEELEPREGIKHHLTKKTLKKCLDSWQPESVVYAYLGSLSRITIEQFVELALGLEASGCPFILVIKAGEGQAPIEDWISENEFEQRTNGRGFLIRDDLPVATDDDLLESKPGSIATDIYPVATDNTSVGIEFRFSCNRVSSYPTCKSSISLPYMHNHVKTKMSRRRAVPMRYASPEIRPENSAPICRLPRIRGQPHDVSPSKG
ncbi:hypothetical protein CQW23_15593 [Capsicum baccatum]|uniref:Uncharacterized protein n=1 Tax=Capsicum baccatum TaxID=33114 RepID=A0A2G2WMG5_CAPBA|nr:hypothetical protein CQW23_15593 [Capsicum baccatum]